MIIARSPLRISIGGGSTDLPSYYEKYGGFVIAGAIDKYVYLTVNETFMPPFIIKYSHVERPESVGEINHPIIREALRLVGHTSPCLEITSLADIPAGTGLGSSGSFTTALLKALYQYKKVSATQHFIAEQACHIEMDLLQESVGKQDPFIAGYGGLTCFTYNPDGSVKTEPLKIPSDTLYTLEDNMAMFFTGYSRSASAILKEQDTQSKEAKASMLDNLHRIKELGYRIKDVLEGDDPERFGELMHEHWENKRKRTTGMTNDRIDHLYTIARENGAVGGKLVGAGGGGFLVFYTRNKQSVRKAMAAEGLKELRFRFEFEGVKLLA